MLTGLWKEFDHGLERCVYDVSVIGVCGVGFGGGRQRQRVVSPVRGEPEDGLQVAVALRGRGECGVGGPVSSAVGVSGPLSRRLALLVRRNNIPAASTGSNPLDTTGSDPRLSCRSITDSNSDNGLSPRAARESEEFRERMESEAIVWIDLLLKCLNCFRHGLRPKDHGR